MGISGGIAGLLGLLLAVEWAVTKSLFDFLKQRNTILIAVFLALSVPFAMLVEGPSIRVDHTGHAGGFLCGLLAGLAHFTRKGIRRWRGIAVLLLLSVLPAAYASHPVLDPHYRIWRARRDYHAGDYAAAARGLERVREMDRTLFEREGAHEERRPPTTSARATRGRGFGSPRPPSARRIPGRPTSAGGRRRAGCPPRRRPRRWPGRSGS
jgi:hypothetical protein